MMSSERRVNLSLHLSPEHSRADLRAMLQLKKWYGEVQRDGRDINDVNMEIRQFHRNIYLAGLQLHQFNPQLCNHIAESLSREGLSLESLCAELQDSKLLPLAIRAGDGGAERSEQQLSQMHELITQAVKESAEHSPRADIIRLSEEVSQLQGLLQRQYLLLQQLRPVAGAAPDKVSHVEESDLSTMQATTQKMNKIRQKGIF